MTDRELLEAAAKTAGLRTISDSTSVWIVEDDGSPVRRWLPLTDDGDALRLALACGLEVREREARWWPGKHLLSGCMREDQGEPYAATRRAIVRAAAAMGGQDE